MTLANAPLSGWDAQRYAGDLGWASSQISENRKCVTTVMFGERLDGKVADLTAGLR
jgi:hypothetical protein